MIRKYLNIAVIAVAMTIFNSCSTGSETHTDEAAEHGHSHSHADPDADEVELTAAQIKAVDIETGRMTLHEIGSTFEANGEVTVDPDYRAQVVTMMNGVVASIKVKSGDRVGRGQIVATVETPEVVAIQQNYAQATETLRLAEANLKRQETLAANGAGIRKNLETATADCMMARSQAESLRRQLEMLGVNAANAAAGNFATVAGIRAPISGTVSSLDASIGSYADSQTPLMAIVDNTRAYVTLAVFEKDIEKVKEGGMVEMRLTNQSAETFTGRISRITPSIDRSTRAIEVRVTIEPPVPANLLSGAPVTAMIHSGCSMVDALPESAIVASQGHNYVFRLEDKHGEGDNATYHFERLEVKLGQREGGFVHVTFSEPVDSSSLFVTDNAFYLGSMTSSHGEHVH